MQHYSICNSNYQALEKITCTARKLTKKPN